MDDEIVPFRFLHLYICTKGQLISKYPFGVFKSPQKTTNFLKDSCPAMMILGPYSIVFHAVVVFDLFFLLYEYDFLSN